MNDMLPTNSDRPLVQAFAIGVRSNLTLFFCRELLYNYNYSISKWQNIPEEEF